MLSYFGNSVYLETALVIKWLSSNPPFSQFIGAWDSASSFEGYESFTK
jgi:hypothetical protein